MPKDTFFNLPDEKRQAITIILLEEFSEQNYQSVSISRIVARAGIAKGSFYQYFEDKRDCYLYLIELAMNEKLEFMRQIPLPDEETDIFGNLRWMMEAGTRFEFNNPRLAQISYRAIFDDVPLPEETMAVVRQAGQTYFQELIEQGIADGTINNDIDPELGAFIFNVVFSNLGKYMLERCGIESEKLLEEGGQTLSDVTIRKIFDQAIQILEKGFGRAAS
jgi:AcrR family transcriptional regulator